MILEIIEIFSKMLLVKSIVVVMIVSNIIRMARCVEEGEAKMVK